MFSYNIRISLMPIDGKKIAKDILDKLKVLGTPKKNLAAFLIGDDVASFGFLKQKEKIAKELGVDFRLYKLPGDITNDQARAEVRKIAESKSTGGVIVQLPLPEHLNRHYILKAVPREKDVDVLSERSLGALYVGRNIVLPPAVGTLEAIIATCDTQLATSTVAIVGLGLLIGKPIANYLMGKTGKLYLLHEGSDLSILKEADLVISGVGIAGLIKPEMLKNGAGVIDFGYSMAQTPPRTNADSPAQVFFGNLGGQAQTNAEIKKISGDFDAMSLVAGRVSLSFYTPTPGGTGPILVAKIFENFYTLANGKKPVK